MLTTDPVQSASLIRDPLAQRLSEGLLSVDGHQLSVKVVPSMFKAGM